MPGRWRAFALIAIFLAAPAAAQQRATGEPVDLALVLAVDASGSVDQVRFELQKQGYVAAFRHPRVIGAVGVSGAPSGDKDEVCAQAGIDKVADQLK